MNNSTIQLIREKVASDNEWGAYLGGPASQGSIAQVESVLKVQLPEEYRTFLSELGSLTIHEKIVAGVYNNQPLKNVAESVVYATNLAMEEIGLISGIIALTYSGGEWCLGLDLRERSKESCPVLEIDCETGTPKTMHANSFEEYLLRLVKSYL